MNRLQPRPAADGNVVDLTAATDDRIEFEHATIPVGPELRAKCSNKKTNKSDGSISSNTQKKVDAETTISIRIRETK